MSFEIKGKNALVTGGGSGIGLEIVKHLLQHNAKKVVFFDINKRIGKYTEEQLNKEYGERRVKFVKVNIADKTMFEDSFQEVIKEIKYVDILINNAGYFNDRKWEMEIKINVEGTFRGILLGLKYMSRDEGGHGGVIVNIASIAALSPVPMFPGYAASKHAILGASTSFGSILHSNRTGVKVLTLCPGGTRTPFAKNSSNKVLTPAYNLENKEDHMPSVKMQDVQYVAKAAIEIIRTAKSGTVWVSEDSQPPYEIEFKPHFERKKIEKNI